MKLLGKKDSREVQEKESKKLLREYNKQTRNPKPRKIHKVIV